MGNAFSELLDTLRGHAQYLLIERDVEEPWRYPKQDLSLLKMFAAQDIETCLQIAHARTIAFREMAVDSIGAALGAAMQIMRMMDEITVELIGVYDKIFLATVEVYQRLWEKAAISWKNHMP